MDENLSLLPPFQHDYFGMAQDLRRMKEKLIRSDKEFDWILLNSICEFEDYCLDQPYLED